MLRAALAYQKLRFAIIPVHTVINGVCTCSKAINCTSPGKHPRTMNGVKDASKDPKIAEKWFAMWPDSNIGIATGDISGIIAIDIDYRNNGEIGISNLESDYGKLPYTVEQYTGGGGRHLLFKHPGIDIANKVNISTGVDIRGDGGFIVVSPSIHQSGAPYIWEASSRPGEAEIAELPEKWLHFLTGKNKTSCDKSNLHIDGIITKGSRNQTIFKLASSLYSKGLSSTEILAAITEVNTIRCKPPLVDEELNNIVNSVQRYEPGKLKIEEAKADKAVEAKMICMADIETEEIKWLWRPYIPLGKITLVQGDPGDGKTTFILNVASIVSKGGSFPEEGEFISRGAGNIIYQTAEDGLGDTIKPRLEKAGADCSKIFVIDESQQGLTLSDERIEKALQEIKPKLFIIDPLQAYLGADTDMHRANEVRPILSKIARLAEQYNCAIAMIMHLSKATQSRSLYRGLGSIDIPAAARSVLLVGKDPNNPQERAIAHMKSSLAPNGKSIAFELHPEKGFCWRGESRLTAEDMLAAKSNSKDSKLEEAIEFLEDLLQGGLEIPSKDIFNKAYELGLSRRTIERAKAELKISSKRIGYGRLSKVVWFISHTPPNKEELAEYENHTPPDPSIHRQISLEHTLAEYDKSLENSGFQHTPPSIVRLEDGGVCRGDGGDIEGS